MPFYMSGMTIESKEIIQAITVDNRLLITIPI